MLKLQFYIYKDIDTFTVLVDIQESTKLALILNNSLLYFTISVGCVCLFKSGGFFFVSFLVWGKLSFRNKKLTKTHDFFQVAARLLRST